MVQRGLLKNTEALSSIKRHLKINKSDAEAYSLQQQWLKEQLRVEPRVELKENYLMQKIFLSYSHHDKDNVTLLAQQLKLHGMRLWRDVEDLTLGTQTAEQIRQTLATECQGCLIYLTPNSLKSDFVMKIELKEAMERLGADKNFALIPLFHGVTIDEARAAVPTYAGRDIANLHGILIPAEATAEQIRNKFTEAAQRLLPKPLEKSRRDFAAEPNRKLILDLHTRHYMYREPQPDLDLDWRPFIQNDDTIDSTVCAQMLWPALQTIEKSVAKALGPRQLLIRASAHLSCGVALGFAFGATTRYQLEIEQPIPGQDTQLWSTINPQPAKSPLQTDSNEVDVSSDEVTLELSVSQPVTAVVNKWVDQRKKDGGRVRARVAIKPPVDLISHKVSNSAEANAIAQQVADELVKLQNNFQPRVVHLFMAVPLALAVLIGYRMNARGVIQLYELRKSDQNYVPSFRLV
jgi:hypothetical protein